MRWLDSVVLPLLVAATFAGLPHATVEAKSLEEHDWILVQTPNFEIRSRLSKKKTLELAHELETFRAAAFLLTSSRAPARDAPTHVWLMKSSDFRRLDLDRNLAGLFAPGLRYRRILVRDRGLDGDAIVRHEFSHALVDRSGHGHPRWLNEGFAELMSSVELDGNELTAGKPPDHVGYRLFSSHAGLSIEDLLTTEGYPTWSQNKIQRFYGFAWALVHYLQVERARERPFEPDLRRYLELLAGGVRDPAAFEQAFGITREELDSTLKKYVRGRFQYVRLTVSDLVPSYTPAVREIPRAEIACDLGALFLKFGKRERAAAFFQASLELDPDHAAAHAGLADVRSFGGERGSEVEALYARAIELAPGDPLRELDFAEHWQRLAERAEDLDARAAAVAKANRHFVRAWKLDDGRAEVYAMYGATLLLEQRTDKARELLEAAEYLNPSSVEIQVLLARAYLAGGRPEDARPRAQSALIWSHGRSRAALSLLAAIDALEAAQGKKVGGVEAQGPEP